MVPGVVKLGMMPSDKKGQLCLVVSDRGDVRTLCSLLFWKIKAFYVFIFQSPLILIYYQFETKKRWLMAWKIRSSHQRCSVRKGVPRNFAKFTGKHLCQDLFYNKVAGFWKIITVFPTISAGPQINAAPLRIHIKISASLQYSLHLSIRRLSE